MTYLSIFLLTGILFLEWHHNLSHYAVLIVAALCIQSMGMIVVNKYNKGWWKSALITSLGLCLLCKTGSLQTTLLAATLAIGSKFIIRFRDKHLFNPVNFGLIATNLITQDSWVSPGQWGSHLILLLVLGALGFIVLAKVQRWDAPLTFFIVFGGLMYANIVWYKGWDFGVFLHSITSGTLVLFAFYMITDPMTTPNHRTGRILWIGLVSFISFVLVTQFYFYSAPIWVLFFMSPLVPLVDKYWKAPKYVWASKTPLVIHS
jgi:Na+-transporting NADH:ubiquinone oxidoreductase subunit NqrB